MPEEAENQTCQEAFTQLLCGRISIQTPVGLTAKVLLFLGLHAAPSNGVAFFFFFLFF